MLPRRTKVAVVLICCCMSQAASAQTPVVPTPLKKTVNDKPVDKVVVPYGERRPGTLIDAGEHPLAALTRIHNSGDGAKLNELAIEILDTLACKPEFFDLRFACRAPKVITRHSTSLETTFC